MNNHLLLAASAAALLAASPLGLAQSSTATSPVSKGSTAITTATGTTAFGSTVNTAQADAKPVQDLEQAAQRLRDAIHAMVQAPAGPQRNEAIRAANEALMQVHNAYGALPPSVLLAAGNDTTSSAYEGHYRQAMTKLETAAQRLRDATHALVREPGGSKRADAIRDVNKALLDTQQAMIDVPMGTRTAAAR